MSPMSCIRRVPRPAPKAANMTGFMTDCKVKG